MFEVPVVPEGDGRKESGDSSPGARSKFRHVPEGRLKIGFAHARDIIFAKCLVTCVKAPPLACYRFGVTGRSDFGRGIQASLSGTPSEL